MKPQKILALPFIVTLVLPAALVFSLFTSTVQAFIAFCDDLLVFWDIFGEWWEEK